eukprot:7770858-Alexandrium_andersonii.AAC.1
MKKERIAEELAALEAQHAQLLVELEEQGSIPPLSMSACQLGPKYLDLFENLVADADFRKGSRVATARAEALDTPLPLSLAQRQDLGQFEVWAQPQPRMPGWSAQ